MPEFVDLRHAATVRRVLTAARHLLIDPRHPDIQGVVVGYKQVANVVTSQLALIILVDRKPTAARDLATPPLVPPGGVVDAGEFLRDDSWQGLSLRLDVQAVGRLRPQLSPQALRQRARPACPGTSIGHIALGGAGTFGACVQDAAGNRYVLSNNHVLALETGKRGADTVGGRFGIAAAGEAITQPGDEPPLPHTVADRIAALYFFEPLLYAPVAPDDVNYCDVALAKVDDPHSLTSAIPFLGVNGDWVHISAVADTVRVGDVVYKVGRTTGATTSTVIHTDATFIINYDAGSVIFDHQCLTGAMSQPGDSGSLVVRNDGDAVGLLFAGSDATSLFSPLFNVLPLLEQRLGVSFSLA